MLRGTKMSILVYSIQRAMTTLEPNLYVNSVNERITYGAPSIAHTSMCQDKNNLSAISDFITMHCSINDLLRIHFVNFHNKLTAESMGRYKTIVNCFYLCYD